MPARHLRSRFLRAGLVAAAGACVLTGPSSAHAASRSTCVKSASQTLEQTSDVRLYVHRGGLYGCALANGRTARLGRYRGPDYTRSVWLWQTDGPYVAYTLTYFTLGHGAGLPDLLVLRDLRSGVRSVLSLGCGPNEPGRTQSVGSLALARGFTGRPTVVWGCVPSSMGPITASEIHAQQGTTGLLLDSGPTVDAASVAISASSLTGQPNIYWVNDGQARRAPLDVGAGVNQRP
jgi:hypothetical protein